MMVYNVVPKVILYNNQLFAGRLIDLLTFVRGRFCLFYFLCWI